jgi:hypothetical protein
MSDTISKKNEKTVAPKTIAPKNKYRKKKTWYLRGGKRKKVLRRGKTKKTCGKKKKKEREKEKEKRWRVKI